MLFNQLPPKISLKTILIVKLVVSNSLATAIILVCLIIILRINMIIHFLGASPQLC